MKHDDNEGIIIQTLFQVGMKWENVGGCREQYNHYGNEIEANKEACSGACTNTMDIDVKS